tara:strand:+ start:3418 stop:3891 length:474 start_codon:yes stop_codon:yes gene_type:complete
LIDHRLEFVNPDAIGEEGHIRFEPFGRRAPDGRSVASKDEERKLVHGLGLIAGLIPPRLKRTSPSPNLNHSERFGVFAFDRIWPNAWAIEAEISSAAELPALIVDLLSSNSPRLAELSSEHLGDSTLEGCAFLPTVGHSGTSSSRTTTANAGGMPQA